MDAEIVAGGLAAAGHEITIWSMFWQAAFVVKLVMVGLLAASVWCWGIIIDKSILYSKTQAAMDRFEDVFWSGQSLDELYDSLENRPTIVGGRRPRFDELGRYIPALAVAKLGGEITLRRDGDVVGSLPAGADPQIKGRAPGLGEGGLGGEGHGQAPTESAIGMVVPQRVKLMPRAKEGAQIGAQ